MSVLATSPQCGVDDEVTDQEGAWRNESKRRGAFLILILYWRIVD